MTLTIRDARSTGSVLVERDAALAALRAALDEAKTGRGRLVIVRGEAGIGKTALVREFAAGLPRVRVAIGSCDGLATPRPFAPLEDLAPALGGELSTLLDAGAAHGRIARGTRDRLAASGPWVVVVEDIQWADEATLELLVFLARRLDGLTSLLVVTYRDDEAPSAAAERTLGRLATLPGVRQLPLARLSRTGVARLAAGTGLDVDELTRLTSGNPLYVHEVLRSGGERLPISIRDAIRARLARLGEPARCALDAAAIAGSPAEPWLVAALAGEDVVGLDDCLREGLLVRGDGIAFAHELTRIAVLEAMPVFRSIALHRRALETLRMAGSTDTARLAHHAEAAADADAAVEHAMAAGRKAEAMSALREAALQYRRAERFSAGRGAAERAEILEHLSHVVYLRGELAEAYAVGRDAVALRRNGGIRPLAASLSALAQIAWLNERGDEARRLVREAVAVLDGDGESRELGLAHDMIGRLAISAGLLGQARTASETALRIGERLDDPQVRAIALANLGTVAMIGGDTSGVALLEASLRVARDAGLAEQVDRALNNLGVGSAGMRDLVAAERYFAALEDFGDRSEIVRCSVDEPRAEVAMMRGDWDAAERLARAGATARDPLDRGLASITLARLAVRRGAAGVDALLAVPAGLVARLESRQVSWPLLACQAERAWIDGTLDSLVPALERAYAEACEACDGWAIGEFWRWLGAAGRHVELDQRAAAPYRLEAAGRRSDAVAEWERLGMPFEVALALVAGGEVENLRQAHAVLVRLGANAFAAHVRELIRARGASAPRGPRSATLEHPEGLTAREVEIASMVAGGSSNAEIADRLVISSRTVAHHVSAILAKLGLERRSQVAPALARPRPDAESERAAGTEQARGVVAFGR